MCWCHVLVTSLGGGGFKGPVVSWLCRPKITKANRREVTDRPAVYVSERDLRPTRVQPVRNEVSCFTRSEFTVWTFRHQIVRTPSWSKYVPEPVVRLDSIRELDLRNVDISYLTDPFFFSFFSTLVNRICCRIVSTLVSNGHANPMTLFSIIIRELGDPIVWSFRSKKLWFDST